MLKDLIEKREGLGRKPVALPGDAVQPVESLDWVKGLARAVVANYLKLVQRGRIQSLKIEWEKAGA